MHQRRAELGEPLTLPCGVTIPNRLVKAAMTEGLADRFNRVTPELVGLYRRWAGSGCGLLFTGNIQVDRRYLERPGNVAIDGNEALESLRLLACAVAAGGAPATAEASIAEASVAGRATDASAAADVAGAAALAAGEARGRCRLFAQLSHGGRQVNGSIWPQPVGPSAVGVPGMEGMFPVPRALSHDEILDIVDRFVAAAMVVRDAGFGGVQVHAAHGYLLSSFLSPLANQREDEWGGSLANRSRLLLAIVRGVRAAVGDRFPVAVKLNVSDFEEGGYGFEECKTVAAWLADAGIDLLEVSGGTHARPVMSGDSAVRAEGYFLEFGRALRPLVPVPLMVTGGFRSHSAIALAIREDGVDLVGMARPYVLAPEVGHRLLQDREATIVLPRQRVVWYYEQIHRLATGREPDVTLDPPSAAAATMLRDLRLAKALAGRPIP